MLFIYYVTCNGPRREPCGTPSLLERELASHQGLSRSFQILDANVGDKGLFMLTTT